MHVVRRFVLAKFSNRLGLFSVWHSRRHRNCIADAHVPVGQARDSGGRTNVHTKAGREFTGTAGVWGSSLRVDRSDQQLLVPGDVRGVQADPLR